MGKKKPFDELVSELESMRNPAVNPEASKIYRGISNDEIIFQIKEIEQQREALLALFPSHLKQIMAKRIDHLSKRKAHLQQ